MLYETLFKLSLLLEANSIDFVVTFQVIEHIQDDHYFLKEDMDYSMEWMKIFAIDY